MRLVSGLALAATAAIVFLACGETQEVTQSESPGVTASATPTASSAPTTAAASATPPADGVPADWETYTDPLGFSLAYPPDLSYTDGGDVTAGGVTRRVVEFRSSTDPKGPRFAISITENSEELTLEEWLQFTACVRETIVYGRVDGQDAIFCTSLPEEIPEYAVLFQHMGRMVYLTSIFMSQTDFDALVNSIDL
jgi:hypothetical protein